jgi:putative glutamine amidotransferase
MPGGDYDIPPAFYGDTTVHDTVVTKVERLEFDLAITKAFLDVDKPVLGICVGQQLLAVMYGGTLIQDIKSLVPGAVEHYSGNREAISHDITIEPRTLFHSIVREERVGVNSHHHQAVKTVGEDMVISAKGSDGVVEAVEVPSKRFCLGVQWHPEFLNEEHDIEIFKALIDACRV